MAKYEDAMANEAEALAEGAKGSENDPNADSGKKVKDVAEGVYEGAGGYTYMVFGGEVVATGPDGRTVKVRKNSNAHAKIMEELAAQEPSMIEVVSEAEELPAEESGGIALGESVMEDPMGDSPMEQGPRGLDDSISMAARNATSEPEMAEEGPTDKEEESTRGPVRELASAAAEVPGKMGEAAMAALDSGPARAIGDMLTGADESITGTISAYFKGKGDKLKKATDATLDALEGKNSIEEGKGGERVAKKDKDEEEDEEEKS